MVREELASQPDMVYGFSPSNPGYIVRYITFFYFSFRNVFMSNENLLVLLLDFKLIQQILDLTMTTIILSNNDKKQFFPFIISYLLHSNILIYTFSYRRITINFKNDFVYYLFKRNF